MQIVHTRLWQICRRHFKYEFEGCFMCVYLVVRNQMRKSPTITLSALSAENFRLNTKTNKSIYHKAESQFHMYGNGIWQLLKLKR